MWNLDSGNYSSLKPTTMTPDQTLRMIGSAWGNGPDCVFTHHFYNLVNKGEVHLYAKPQDMDERLWRQALEDNPDKERLVPVQAKLFGDLKTRVEEQVKTNKNHEKALQTIELIIEQIQQKHELNTLVKIEEYKRRHMELSARVLRIMKKVDLLQNLGRPISTEEEAFRSKLEKIERELQMPTQFKGRLNELLSLVRMQEDVVQVNHENLDEESLETISKFLQQQQKGIQTLSQVVAKDMKDLAIIMEGLK